MKNSVGVVFSWRRWKYVAWADSELAAPLWRLIGVTLTNAKWGEGDYSENSTTAQHFLEHNALVRKVCPPERLLNFKLGSGWEPLCEFLGVEVPDVPYPNVNDTEMFVGLHKLILDRATAWAVQKVLAWTVPVGIFVAGAAWYWQ
jgi:Sulfotransferase domain